MASFRFHGWLIVEVFTDAGHRRHRQRRAVAALTKQLIDLYLKPLLIGKDPFDSEFLWQHMYRQTMAFGRKGVAMVGHQRGRYRPLGPSRQSRPSSPYSGCSADAPNRRFRSTPAVFTASRWISWQAKREATKKQGYRAMKLRFGWGPVDGAAGMQHNLELVRTRARGDRRRYRSDGRRLHGLDARLCPAHGPAARAVPLRWLEEPVIPDDIHGYAALKALGRVPIAGGEHEHTIYGFRQLLEAKAVDYIQFDTNRVGGITQARKIAALAEAHSVPGDSARRPDAQLPCRDGQLTIRPWRSSFPSVDVEIGNELFWYIFDGEPTAENGTIDLSDDVPGLGLTIKEDALKDFDVIE